MKQFMKVLGTDLAVSTLKTVRFASVCTIGIGAKVVEITNNTIVAGCNLGVNRLTSQKKTSLKKEMQKVHDYQQTFNKVIDGRVTMEELYNSMMPDEWVLFLEFITGEYAKTKNDLQSARL